MKSLADNYLIVRSKTGNFVHLGHKGSMRTHCGVRAPIVVRGAVSAKQCCEKCFGPEPANFNKILAGSNSQISQ